MGVFMVSRGVFLSSCLLPWRIDRVLVDRVDIELVPCRTFLAHVASTGRLCYLTER